MYSWSDKLDLRSNITLIIDCRKLNIHHARIVSGCFADFVFCRLNTANDNIIQDTTCKPSPRTKGGYLQPPILPCNCENNILMMWLTNISRQQTLLAWYETPRFMSAFFCSWLECLLLSGLAVFDLCLHHLILLNRNWATILVINTTCINAKVLVQKQGEYTSGHFRRYCDIIESAMLHSKKKRVSEISDKIGYLSNFLSYDYDAWATDMLSMLKKTTNVMLLRKLRIGIPWINHLTTSRK